MNLQDEKIITVTDDPKFNAIYAERVRRERKREIEKWIIKLLIFFSLFLFYSFFFFVNGYWQYFFGYPEIDRTMDGNPLHFLFAFIVGVIFIWLPLDTLDNIGRINWGTDGSGGTMERSPAEALRFFGWVIYILPAIFFIIYYLIR